MSANICPVVQLGAPRPIPGADKIEVFDIFGSGPCISVKGDFNEGDLACFIPPETMVDTTLACFDFLKKTARKSDGWAKVHAVRLRGQVSVGLLMHVGHKAKVGDDLAAEFKVKKPEDFDPHVQAAIAKAKKVAPWYKRMWWSVTKTGPHKVVNAPWPGIPMYDVTQFYKLPTNVFKDDTLMVATEKLHGTNARYVIGKDGRFRVGSRTRWLDPIKDVGHNGNGLDLSPWHRAAAAASLEAKMRRLAEPLVCWGEIVGPGVQKGFDYGVKEPTFYCFDFYHATERRFLSQSETYNLCRWLEIKHVPQNDIETWGEMKVKIAELARGAGTHANHPSEGVVIRPYTGDGIINDLAGNANKLAGKVINPAYYEFRHRNGDDFDEPTYVAGPV